MFLKNEFGQFTDSVKARGVVYALLQLTKEQKCKGVIGISTGSFAYTLCYFGKKLGIPVTVVMPTSTADDKIKMCQMHSDSRTTVLIRGSNMIEAHNTALHIAQKMGLFYLDGYFLLFIIFIYIIFYYLLSLSVLLLLLLPLYENFSQIEIYSR
jgi:threonine dehydratase